MVRYCWKIAIVIVLGAAGLFIQGCQEASEQTLVGDYMAKHPQSQMITISLKADQKGSWTLDTQTLEFEWDADGQQILLHTANGGVIAGDILKDGFRIRLPGVGHLDFKKTTPP